MSKGVSIGIPRLGCLIKLIFGFVKLSLILADPEQYKRWEWTRKQGAKRWLV